MGNSRSESMGDLENWGPNTRGRELRKFRSARSPGRPLIAILDMRGLWIRDPVRNGDPAQPARPN